MKNRVDISCWAGKKVSNAVKAVNVCRWMIIWEARWKGKIGMFAWAILRDYGFTGIFRHNAQDPGAADVGVRVLLCSAGGSAGTPVRDFLVESES